MLLLTIAMIATAASAPDTTVEKKLPLLVDETQQELQVAEEAKSDELVFNDVLVVEEPEEVSDEE